MELDKAIKERRTVRKYSEKAVSWLAVSEILDAGRMAPSAGNLQNWFFVVVRKKEVREKVVKFCQDSSWAVKAPVFVVICVDIEKAKKMFGAKGETYSIQNGSCAAMQMMLKAYDLGVSSAWIGGFDEVGVSKELSITNAKPICILTLGHGETQEEMIRHELNTMVFFDKFGEKERKGDYAMLPLSVPLKRNVEPMKEKLQKAFDNETTQVHKDKVKEFVKSFIKNK